MGFGVEGLGFGELESSCSFLFSPILSTCVCVCAIFNVILLAGKSSLPVCFFNVLDFYGFLLAE